MNVMPQEMSEDPRVRYDAAAARILFPVAMLVGSLLLLRAIADLVMLQSPLRFELALVAGISAAVLLMIGWRWRRPTTVRQASLTLAAVFLVVILDALLHVLLIGQDWQTSKLMLITIAIGMAILQRGWFVALTVLVWAGFLVGAAFIPGEHWFNWAVAMGVATLIGTLMHLTRRSYLRQAADVMAQQRDLLQQAQDLAEARRALLTTISHDVKTPVTGIVGMVDLMLDRPMDARTRELVIGVRNSTTGLTTLLNNLLDEARVEAGRLELYPERTHLQEVIDGVLTMVSPLAQYSRVPLVAALTPDCPGVLHTDGRRLSQVLLNLVSNAVKFTDRGAVSVIARPAEIDGDPGVEVVVTDSGPGLTPEELETIFEAFVQGSSGVSQRRGSGMGLAIARRLTAALGGELTVDSAVGRGTAFHVTLPLGDVVQEPVLGPESTGDVVVTGHPIAVEAVTLAMTRLGRTVVPECAGRQDTLHVRVVAATDEPEAQRMAEDDHRLVVLGPVPTVSATPTAGEYVPLPLTGDRVMEVLGLRVADRGEQAVPTLPPGLRVLLAEDDATNRALIAEMLRRMGADVTAVSDGAAAVEEVARDRYDTVLLDLNMPVIDGLAAVRLIRERLAGPGDLSVLALTADSAWKDHEVLLAAGFNGRVLKPTTRAHLHDSIWGALQELPVPPPAVSATEPSGVDVTVLDALAEDVGGSQLVAEAMGIYLEELPTRLVLLHVGSDSGSREDVRSTAHALKGASGMLGAHRMQLLSQQLEHDPANTALLGDIYTEAEVVETQMRAILGTLTIPAGSVPQQ